MYIDLTNLQIYFKVFPEQDKTAIHFRLTGSVIASAWRTMTEEWENTSRMIKTNAEALESKALDRLNTLMSERRKARKAYQEDHTKISSQFTQVGHYISYLPV